MNKALPDTNILKVNERLQAIDWPELKKVEVPPIEAGDCLLVCAGFEDRAIEALHRICDAGRKDFSLGIVEYLPEYPENKIQELEEIAQSSKLTTQKLVYDRKNPAGIGEKLNEIVEQVKGRIFVDISGMSRLLIVQTLVALIGEQNTPVTIIYGEAEEYPPSEEEFQNSIRKENDNGLVHSYLSSGIFEIAITPELSSVAMLGEAIRLIAFPSFDHTQLTNVIQELQPTYVEVIHGVPPDENNKWRTDAIRVLNKSIIDMIKKPEEREASTLDYRRTLEILLEIYEDRNMFDRLVIAPTGSKMQSVAVGILRAFLHDIQIVYPTPHITQPGNYTYGLKQLYEVNIPCSLEI